MFTNNDLDWNLKIEVPFSSPTPPPPLEKLKFFNYSATLLKFETEHLYNMLTNNKDIKI